MSDLDKATIEGILSSQKKHFNFGIEQVIRLYEDSEERSRTGAKENAEKVIECERSAEEYASALRLLREYRAQAVQA